MATVQVETWVATHNGSIDRVSDAVDTSLADAALARMMLHRRRAAVAKVISEFFAGVGKRFMPYLCGRAPQSPRDMQEELTAAASAGGIVASLCGAPPPLLFERALLAEMEGRDADALADLDQLLDTYPGFLAAATMAARLALAGRDPARAVRSLAYVERELTITREGSALLADALRAVGLHESASRYDLAALVCSGHHDSRGNDCAPVDVMGHVAHDQRMQPLGITAESRPDWHILCNDRGVYYLASSKLGALIFEAMGGVRLISTTPPSRPASASPGRHSATGVARIYMRFGGRPLRNIKRLLTNGLLIPPAALTAINARLRGIFAAVGSWLWRLARRLLAVLYARHRASAARILETLNRYVPPSLRYWEWSFVEIAERDRRSEVARARLQFGIAQIFRTPAGAHAVPSAQVPSAAAAILSQLISEGQLINKQIVASDR